MIFKIPLIFSPQPEGGYTVTSPLLPELITEGDTINDALVNVHDALEAVIEAYHDLGKTLPPNIYINDLQSTLWFDTLLTTQ
jgi:antitoxin HicB